MKLTYRFIKYCIVGSITTLEGWGLIWLITETLLSSITWIVPNYILSSIVATPIVMASAFTLNNWWTWGTNNDQEVQWLTQLISKLKKEQKK